MIIISHRGNINGPNTLENHPDQIKSVLNLGFDCEVDLWVEENSFILGHDKPQYEIDCNFLRQPGLWIHCKNFSSLQSLPNELNYFWHQEDDFTLTSKGYIWTYPQKKTGYKSIIVDNDKNWASKKHNCFGVCTDWITLK